MKKMAFIAGTAAALMMGTAGAASAGQAPAELEVGDNVSSHQVEGLLAVDEVVTDNNINVCDLNVNVLAIQVKDVANGLTALVPVLNTASPVANEEGATADCIATSKGGERH